MREMADCVFCAIAAGSAPARIVAEYPLVLALLPLHPAALGHTLVIPRRHIPTLADLDRPTAHAVTDATLDVAARVSRVVRPDGLNVVQSNGAAATQSALHLHVHLVPRTAGDDLPALWPPARDWPPAALDDLAARLLDAGDSGQRTDAITT